jgi:hypothetical protein
VIKADGTDGLAPRADDPKADDPKADGGDESGIASERS